ncbi:MAG: dihydrolipoamide acetyltransferase family protein [Candidatus Geothermarchaeales archaeon]
MQIVIMPRLDLAMDSGVVLEWLIQEGERVEKDKPLATIMTEKVTYDLPSPASGTLYRTIVPVEVEVPVGQTIAVITEPGDDMRAVDKAVEEARKDIPEVKMPEPEVAEKAEAVKVRVERERVKISPLARKLAEKYGVDVTRVKGTGPGGRIVKSDILKAVESLEAKPPSVPTALPRVTRVIPLRGVRKVIAERMAYSYGAAPHVTITMGVDMTRVVKIRQDLEEEGKSISYNAFLTKAASKALGEHPIINSTLEGDQIKVFEDINVGVAVATDQGLIVPVVQNADEKTLDELNLLIDELAEKARQGRLTVSEVKGGTFTITNLGMFGVETFTPIITPKQTAILGVGRIAEKPLSVEGRAVTRPTLTLSLSFDHRVVDGAQAAQFLKRIKEILETFEMAGGRGEAHEG